LQKNPEIYVSAFAQALYIDEYHNSHGPPGDLKWEISIVSLKSTEDGAIKNAYRFAYFT